MHSIDYSDEQRVVGKRCVSDFADEKKIFRKTDSQFPKAYQIVKSEKYGICCVSKLPISRQKMGRWVFGMATRSPPFSLVGHCHTALLRSWWLDARLREKCGCQKITEPHPFLSAWNPTVYERREITCLSGYNNQNSHDVQSNLPSKDTCDGFTITLRQNSRNEIRMFSKSHAPMLKGPHQEVGTT